MRTKLFIALGVILFLYTNAQVNNLYSAKNLTLPQGAAIEENTIQSVFSQLDKSKIQTGLLLDAAIEFADLQKYNGKPTDSSFTSAKVIGDIYNTIVMSKISPNKGTLKPPADFQDEWFNTQAMDCLPIGGVYYQYNRFSEDNLHQLQTMATASTGNIRTTNISTASLTVTPDNTITDLYTNGVWQNPYEIDKVFAMAPIANTHNKLNFSVVFPQNVFLSNEASEISNLEVKFADHENFKTVNFGQPIPVNYPSIGEYTWTYKLTLRNGEILYSKNKFFITEDLGKYTTDGEDRNTQNQTSYAARSLGQYRKVELEKFPYFIPIPPSVVNRPKLTLYIRYRTGQSQITKPFIVVEGFDAGHITAPRREAGDTNIDTFINNNGIGNSELQAYLLNNYDIIYVDWGIGTDYIQNNAELLKKAIRWVNQNKVGTEKNIVLGQSMGGLVARYALKDMEDQGENHDTSLYISHDAPHLGANTPLGLQYMLRNISKTFLRSPIVAGINYIITPIFHGVPISEVLTVADTPASRQMLINYIDKGENIDNSVHHAWQASLREKGYPQTTRNVAISNGSECGTDQNMQDLLRMNHTSKGWFIDIIGALVGGLTLDINQVILSILPGQSRYHYNFVVRPMTSLNQNKELYNGSIVYKKKILWVINAQNTLLSGRNYQPQGILPIDKYGGGKYEFPASSLPSIIGSHLSTSSFSFVPTPSALDYKQGYQELTEEDYQKSFSPEDDIHHTPFANFVAEKIEDKNYHHISFSRRSGQFIINQLSFNPDLQNQKLTTAYLCGSKVKIGGEALLCGNTSATYTTGFAPYINWSVIEGATLIEMTGPYNQPQISFTPKPGANGLVKLQAYLSGDGSSNTVTQKIWIGKPQIHTKPEEGNTNYVVQNIKSLNKEATLEDQGLTPADVTWKRKDTGAMQTGYTYFANGRGNRWHIDVEVSAKNKCGNTTYTTTITPPPPGMCDYTYTVSKIQNDQYTVIRIIDPVCPKQTPGDHNLTQSTLSSTYHITVVNSLGNTIIQKTGKDFSLSNFPTGSYFVKIIKDGQMLVEQTLIKK